MLLVSSLSLIIVSPTLTKAFNPSGVIRWKSSQSLTFVTQAKRLHRFFHQQSMSSSSEWIVSSLDDTEKDGRSTEEETPTEKSIPTHLFLHFDINETILLGDDAGGDSRNESIEKMLAKSAFCQIPASSGNSWEDTHELEPTHWWDGQEIGKETSMPPLYTGWKWPKNCCPYYRTAYKKHAKYFTEEGHHGQIYAPLLQACEASLPKTYNMHSGHTILPAFYDTLCHLIADYQNSKESQRPPFTVIFRTFGSDVSDIASVVTSFAKGEHPEYPDIKFPPLYLTEDRLYQGHWKEVEEGKVVYQLWTSDESELVASGDAEILEVLSGKAQANKDESPPVAIYGIVDDYPFWDARECSPTAGKPIWVPQYNRKDDGTPYSHHLFFDDNIHNLADDGIASVRKESTVDEASAKSFDTVDGSKLTEYQGIHLVRVPTVEPVLNPKWYIEQIEKARKRLQLQLQSQL